MRPTALGDIAQFINGLAFKPEDWGTDGRRIIRIQNLNDPSKPYNFTTRDVQEKFLINKGDLLVSWSASLGVYEWPYDDEAVLNQHIFKVIPDQSLVHQPYLRHMLEKALIDMAKHHRGSTMVHVNRGEFLGTEIPLPPLKEQKRIAGILDQADALRRLRARALEKLNTLGQAVFQEMFGDPSKDWPEITVAEVTKDARTGPFGSQLLISEFVESGVPVLGIDNVVQNKFRWAKERYITAEKYEQLKRYQVKPGDVLVTIMGTCGRCAVVPDNVGLAINTKHICCMTMQPEKIEPEFLQASLLWDSKVLAQLGVESKGAIMPGLNMGKIAALQFKLPPLELQREFKARVSSIETEVTKNISAMNKAESLFASLQSTAFQGKL